MVSPCFPCFSMLCKSMEKHGKHGNIFQVTPAEHGLAWNSWDRAFLSFRIAWKSKGSMEQHFLMISDSMGKHGEHGKSLIFITSKSMGKHGKHGTAFSHDFRQHGKAWGAWNSILS